jgi:GAF domain-containing protein
MVSIPIVLEKILSGDSEPDAVFSALMPALGEVLQCDRCFLYLRDPQTHLGKVAYCWRRSPEYPDVTDSDWKEEPKSLMLEDPLWAAAMRTEPSIFVEDVETANPNVVNKAFEQKTFGHRALVHAHLCCDGQLWGILQPCVFGQPRVWTEEDHFIIATVTEKIAPLAVSYVKAAVS